MICTSKAVITAEPSDELDGNWHITQTDRGPGAATEIFLKPVKVAGGRRPAVGTEGILTETFKGRESKWRWEPLHPEQAGPPFGTIY